MLRESGLFILSLPGTTAGCKMNVVHYVAAFSPLSQTFIYDLVVGLEKRGLTRNTVLTRRRELSIERPFERTFVCKDRNPIRKLLSKVTDPSHLKIHNQKIILDRFKEANVDIVHSHFAISALRMNDLLIKNKLNIPHICSFHGNDVLTNPFKIPGYREALLRLNDYPNILMTVPSQFLKDVCIRLGLNEEKIKVVHNTIHPRFIEHKEAAPWDGVEKLKIVTVGRLVEMKGHEYAIKGMAELRKTFSHFEYIIAGSGALEYQLKELSNNLGLQDHVKFVGNVGHEKVPELLSQCHVCLIPSIRAHDGEEDTFCLSLVEGSVAGLFCLSSDTRGPVEVMGPHTDLIFKQKDPFAQTRAILKAVEDHLAMAEKSRELRMYMIDNFHPDAYFNNYSDTYKSMLGSR